MLRKQLVQVLAAMATPEIEQRPGNAMAALRMLGQSLHRSQWQLAALLEDIERKHARADPRRRGDAMKQVHSFGCVFRGIIISYTSRQP